MGEITNLINAGRASSIGEPFRKILSKHGVAPDFSFLVAGNQKLGKTMYAGNGMEYIHRKVGVRANSIFEQPARRYENH